LQQVYEQPDNDEVRLVLADWLQERDDPRGRFIALQYQKESRNLSPQSSKEEQQLLKKYGPNWIQPIYRNLDTYNLGFSKGFLSDCEVESVSEHNLHHPVWNTAKHMVAPVELLVAKQDHVRVWGCRKKRNISATHEKWYNFQGIPLKRLQRLSQERTTFAVQAIVISESKSWKAERLDHFRLDPQCFPHLNTLVWWLGNESELLENIRNNKSYQPSLEWISTMVNFSQIECLIIAIEDAEIITNDAFLIPSRWKNFQTLHLGLGYGWYADHHRDDKGHWELRITRVGKQYGYQFNAILNFIQQIQYSNYDEVWITSTATPFTNEEYKELVSVTKPYPRIKLE
jgi:uncharacterized protein (TIGR02996 family)